MATTANANLIKLYLRPNGSTAAFAFVVCNEDLSLDGSADEVSRPTKTCGVLKTAGAPSYEIPYSGVANFNPGIGQVSEAQLAEWFNDGTTLDFVFGDASSGATKVDRSGTGIITSHTMTTPVDDLVGFEGTFSVSGQLTITL